MMLRYTAVLFTWIVLTMRQVYAFSEIAELTDTVIAVESGRANLPCNITPPSLDDAVALVLWYKDDSTTPLYSLDARRGNLNQARHAAGEEVTRRAYLTTVDRPSILQLDHLTPEDEGEYRCRVDFRKARSRNSLVILEIITLPKTPIIMDGNGEILQKVSGPHNEGDRLLLVCEVEGGKPQPGVTWWKDSVLLDDTYEVTPHGVVRNELYISSLERKDLLAVYTCQASNNNVSVPVSASVTVDLNLVPLEVQIEGKHRPLSANKPAELLCHAGGSRPPAVISWWKGNTKLKRTKNISSEGNITTSKLIFVPSIEDAGKYLSCRAENPAVNGNAIEDGWKMAVYFTPHLTLRLGSKLRHSHIQEGNDVYLECDIQANPWVTEIGWRFEGRELHTNTSSGIIVSNQSLVLQKVQRAHRGKYTCTASNTEGNGESSPLYLRVQYSPICRQEQKTLYGVARHEPVKVRCEVEADPLEVAFSWKFNNTAESLELMSFVSDGNKSIVTYIPRTEYDYGSLLCWAKNNVGFQREPCVFTVIPAGPPDSVQNCSVTNHTEDSFVVRCIEGYDGGLFQHFVMEVYADEDSRAINNVTGDLPVFVAQNLPASTSFEVIIYSANAKGRSKETILRSSTLSIPESLTQREDTWHVTFSPMLIVLICVVVGLVLVAVTIVLVMKARNRIETQKDMPFTLSFLQTSGIKKHGNDKSTTPLRHDTDDRRETTTVVPEGEDKCPDLIPGMEMTGDTISEAERIKQGAYPGDPGMLETTLVNPSLPYGVLEFQGIPSSNHPRPQKHVPSPSIPQLPEDPLRQLPDLNEFYHQQMAIAQNNPNTRRGEWTLPRATAKLKNRQTDV